MNKKMLAFVAAGLMALSFGACSKNKKDASTTPAATETKPADGAATPEGGAAPANPCNPTGGEGAANPCAAK
jgi:hypothetical protein